MSETRASGIALGRAGSPAAPIPWLGVYAAAVAAVTLWAGTAIVTKIAVGAFDPVLVAALRSTGAALLLLAVLPFVRVPLPRDRRGWRLLVASALGGFVIFPLLYSLGLQRTTVSHGALILTAQPLFTGVCAAVAERRLPGRRWLLGCAIAMLGEIALIGLRIGIDSQGGLLGDMMILASGFSASLGYITGSRLSHSIGTWSTTLWGNIIGGALMVPVLVLRGLGADWHAAGPAVWASAFYLALCSSIIGYVAWYWALARGGAARIGTVQFGVPLIALVLAVVVLGETLTLALAAAGAVILFGIYVAQKR